MTMITIPYSHKTMTVSVPDNTLLGFFKPEGVVNNENIVVHDAFDEASMLKLGKLPSGGEWLVLSVRMVY